MLGIKSLLSLEEDKKARTIRPGNVYKLSVYGSVCVPTAESWRNRDRCGCITV